MIDPLELKRIGQLQGVLERLIFIDLDDRDSAEDALLQLQNDVKKMITE